MSSPARAATASTVTPWSRPSASGAQALLETLRSVDPATSVWTFSSTNRTAAFWQRRRTQEIAVHRYDAETAAGTPTPIDTALAVDGIDEFLTVFLPRLADNFGDVGDGTVHLHCTDVDGEWLVARHDGEVVVTAEHAKGDVAARGGASDLLLFLWGRVPADSARGVRRRRSRSIAFRQAIRV